MKRGTRLLPLFLVPLYLAALWAASRAAERPIGAIGLGLVEDSPACSAWEQVAAPGFGMESFPEADLQSPTYQNEDAFEVLVFRDQLYVGMEADNAFGARLWRTRRGVQHPEGLADWEEVIADADGRPWGIEERGQVDHIDSLAEFEGMLYVSSASRDETGGARLYRSATGDSGSWEDALVRTGPGFGDPANENFKDMQVFDNRLCGGTWNVRDGAEVWCSADGLNWAQTNRSGFGEAENAIIWSGAVFEDRLYFGLQRLEAGTNGGLISSARIYRTASLDDPDAWELVFDGGPYSYWAGLLGSVDGSLFAAVPSLRGLQILRSGDGRSWIPAGLPGVDNSRYNTSTVTDGGVRYNGVLHAAVANPLTGFRVWQLSRPDFWAVIGDPSAYDRGDRAAQLAVFNGSLYAWTTDYAGGQTVLRTTCSAVPASASRQGWISAGILAALGAVFAFWIRRRGYNRSEGHSF